VVLEVIAKDRSGREIGRKRIDYVHMGIDVDNYQRHGAWQIKEIIDLSIQPLETRRERIELWFEDSKAEARLEGGTITSRLVYFLKSDKSTVVAEKTVPFNITEGGCQN
jgi:hypothetical protein